MIATLIDHVFLSAEMANKFGADDYFIVAAEKSTRKFLEKISDHRPVVVRLSLHDVAREEIIAADDVAEIPESLIQALRELREGEKRKGASA